MFLKQFGHRIFLFDAVLDAASVLLASLLFMLASVAEDAAEAKDCYATADSLWQMVRRASTVDHGEVDRSLNEIRGELDELKDALTKEDEAADEEAAKETAAENEDPMELDSADADEPAMPVEKMHKLTLAKKAAASKPET